MLYQILTIVFLTVSSITSLPLQPQDEGNPPLSKEDSLESNAELASEELASLLRDIQEVVKDEPSVMSLEEYDYSLEVSNQEQIVLVEEIQEDKQYNYIYEDSIPGVDMQQDMREEQDVEKVVDNLPGTENKEIFSDESSYVVEDDGKVDDILTGKDNSEIAEYDYNDDDESNYVEEDDGIVKDILIGKEGNEIVSEYDYKSEYVVVFDVPSEYKDDPEYRKFVEAAKLKDANKRSRMIVEFAMMSGMGIIGLTIMFGLISLANSCLRTRTSIHPQQVQITTTGGIIKQYTRVPVEIKNLLPSNVAYKQLYES